MAGMLEFDGRQYLDGESSDPKLLGLMQGSPPRPDQRIRFQDDRFLEFPRDSLGAVAHARALPYRERLARRGRSGRPRAHRPGDAAAIDAVQFEDVEGRTRTFGASHQDVYTDGIVILHRGRRVYERYFGALQAHIPHACFSITKSYVATIAATLIHEGVLDDAQLVSHYLPEMANTAYGDATLRELLDMQIGVAYSEAYADPHAEIWAYARAGGLRPRPPDYSGPDNFYESLLTLRKEGATAVRSPTRPSTRRCCAG